MSGEVFGVQYSDEEKVITPRGWDCLDLQKPLHGPSLPTPFLYYPPLLLEAHQVGEIPKMRLEYVERIHVPDFIVYTK